MWKGGKDGTKEKSQRKMCYLWCAAVEVTADEPSSAGVTEVVAADW